MNFNEKYGNPAYVVVNGIIYDMPNSRAFENGVHNGHVTGNNLAEEINTKSPHGVGTHKGAPAIGGLVE